MFFFISLICRSYLCIWDTNHLSVLHKANKHFEASHFISFMVSVHIQKLSGLRGSFMNLSLYGLYFQALRMMNFSLLFSHNNYCHYSSFGAQIVKLSSQVLFQMGLESYFILLHLYLGPFRPEMPQSHRVLSCLRPRTRHFSKKSWFFL